LRITSLLDAKINLMKIAKSTAGAISLSFACFAYLVAVTQRSNLGVAALEASDRFQVSATQLSSLGVLQLVIYAVMQVPVGVLLDRYGAKAMLVFGSIAMGLGQLLVAFATGFEAAALGRMLVGFGDAFIFISLTRTVNAWFTGTKASVIQQLVANLGQLGQVMSAIPFHFALQTLGWSPAFSIAAIASVMSSVLCLAFIRSYAISRAPISLAGVKRLVFENLRDPATRTAFWVHFTLQSSGSSFVLLWGYPYLVSAQGFDPEFATGLLSAFVFIGFVVGPLISAYAAKSSTRKYALTMGLGLAIIAAWILVLITPAALPIGFVLVFVLIVGAGGPASMMAFDYSRKLIPAQRMGTANGLINTGGFIAAFSLMLGVGLLLDLAQRTGFSTSTYSNTGFQLAFWLEPAVVAFGLWRFHVASRTLSARISPPSE
jgi:MFS family permease